MRAVARAKPTVTRALYFCRRVPLSEQTLSRARALVRTGRPVVSTCPARPTGQLRDDQSLRQTRSRQSGSLTRDHLLSLDSCSLLRFQHFFSQAMSLEFLRHFSQLLQTTVVHKLRKTHWCRYSHQLLRQRYEQQHRVLATAESLLGRGRTPRATSCVSPPTRTLRNHSYSL